MKTPTDVPAVVLKDLCLRFGNFDVVKGLDLTVHQGERVVVIGPSGSGKSSVIRCVNGLVRPLSGDVEVLGVPLYRRPSQTRAAQRRMGMIFQSFNLYSTRTVAENVVLGLRHLKRLPLSEAWEVARRSLKTVGCEALLDQFPFQLSGGQKQRVALARALALGPELLLLDEPTSALDPELIKGVLNLVLDATINGRTAICITHELGFARRFADRVIFMDQGRIVEQGAPELVFSTPQSERLKKFLSSVDRGTIARGPVAHHLARPELQ